MATERRTAVSTTVAPPYGLGFFASARYERVTVRLFPYCCAPCVDIVQQLSPQAWPQPSLRRRDDRISLWTTLVAVLVPNPCIRCHRLSLHPLSRRLLRFLTGYLVAPRPRPAPPVAARSSPEPDTRPLVNSSRPRGRGSQRGRMRKRATRWQRAALPRFTTRVATSSSLRNPLRSPSARAREPLAPSSTLGTVSFRVPDPVIHCNDSVGLGIDAVMLVNAVSGSLPNPVSGAVSRRHTSTPASFRPERGSSAVGWRPCMANVESLGHCRFKSGHRWP